MDGRKLLLNTPVSLATNLSVLSLKSVRMSKESRWEIAVVSAVKSNVVINVITVKKG